MPREIVYKKLVRDLIPQIVEKDGKRPVVRIASPEEFREKLYEKLKEEVEEFLVSEKPEEELADILEVMHAIYELLGTSHEGIEDIRLMKAEKRGRFSQRIILEMVIEEE